MAFPYQGGEYFSSAVFLVLANRVFGAVVGFIFPWIFGGYSMAQLPNKASVGMARHPPVWKYALISASNVLASAFQYEALKFVSFAVQIVGKSTKMLPVMMWGVLISAKFYRRSDWSVALVMTVGCLCFLVGGDISAASRGPAVDGLIHSHLLAYGLVLTVASITFDGFTSMYQEQLFREYGMSPFDQMVSINLCSAAIALAVLAASGEMAESIVFCNAHPDFAWDVFLLSATAAAGQVAIYTTISWFGAVVFAAMINVRQVVSIALSSIYFSHALTAPQVLGSTLIFGALGWKAVDAMKEPASPPPVQKEPHSPPPVRGEV